MAKKTQMSPWVHGPKHNWKTTQKSRQDADADIVEETYVERSIYVYALATVAACIAGWWWQASLDGWPRGIVLAATLLVTIYIAVMGGSLVVFALVGRFIRNAML